MRRAPPTVPGTPMSPSIPPRSFFAQKVIMRPRSAAASTWARLPSNTTSGSGRTSWRTTQGNSPSPTSRFEPPPRNLYCISFASSRFRRPGRHSCLRMRTRSVVPPMPSEVMLASKAPCCSSAFSSARPAMIFGSRMCMRRWMLRSQQNHEFIARPADVARTNGQDGVSAPRLFQEIFDAFLHGAEIVDVLVAGFSDGARQCFAGHAGDGGFAGSVDVEQRENVGLIEGAAEIVPEMLGAAVTMRLKEHEKPVELAATGCFEGRTNLGRVMAVVVNYGDIVDHTLDVKAAAYSSKFDEAFANQVSRNI